ncbi:MAG: histidinol-phosphate transaminase [Polyangiaceae bacterium]|jgi:histidinol-phosphate aminotransferase
MQSWSSLLRPELGELSAYVPADPPGIDVRLDANEAPFLAPFSAALREVVARAIGRVSLERYPDATASELKSRIAERTGAAKDEIVVGSGSDELLSVMLTALARPREGAARASVLVFTPTFVNYALTSRTHGLHVVDVPLDSRWDLDVAAARRAIAEHRPNVVFVASPNNPTGNRASDDRLEALLTSAPDALVVLDEAYVDYAGSSLRTWRTRFANLAILRTLSKVGLASLRVGWLEAPAGLARELDKVRQPYNLNAVSQAVAAAVVAEAWDVLRERVDLVVAERERVTRAIGRLGGFDVSPSRANFLWVGTPRPAKDVYEELTARGILVRSFHKAGGRLANHLRITIGAPDENDRLVEALATL